MSQLRWITIVLLMGLSSGCYLLDFSTTPGTGFTVSTTDSAHFAQINAPVVDKFRTGDTVAFIVNNLGEERYVSVKVRHIDTNVDIYDKKVNIPYGRGWYDMVRVEKAGPYMLYVEYEVTLICQSKFYVY